VLSRKGFDSATGGGPSPILEDGSMVSMPIPDRGSGISFKDVLCECSNGKTVASLLPMIKGCRCQPDDEVHLDPDLRREAIATRDQRWRPIFGQCGAAQSHLDKQEVGLREEDYDLFLFYGYFRAVGSAFQSSRQFREGHVIFGWLQIQERCLVSEARSEFEWASYHPHIRLPAPQRVSNEMKRRKRKPDNNTIFLARDSLSFLPSISGGGVFRTFDARLCLTASPMGAVRRSLWVELPCERTRHRQEHVLHVSESSESKLRDWLVHIFTGRELRE
jgi:hypothetical protein